MATLTKVLRHMLEGVKKEADAITLVKLDLPEVPSEIPSIHFAEAQRLIVEHIGERIEGEPDLAPAHERWLGEMGATAIQL